MRAAVTHLAGTGPAGTGAAGAELLSAISAVHRTARRAVRQAWQAEPLPTAQVELLRLAAARPGISVTEAAQELRLAPNTVSTLVGRLTAQGLLRRERTHPDGRAVRLAVTGKAQRRLKDWRDLRGELAQAAIAQLDPADQDTLASAAPALRRLAERLALA
jgi:DNA-binding MarR family transcriptional regulator